jgi:hypothetical protein
MQFNVFLGLAMLAGSAVPSSLGQLDPKPIVDSLKNISQSVQAMTTGVQFFDGDAAKGAAILGQAEAILVIMSSSATAVSNITALGLVEAVQILQPANALVSDVQKVIDALISKKPEFDKANLSSVVTSTLQKIKPGAEAVIKAVTGKLPASVSSIGESIGKQIYTALDKGLAAYAK